MILVIVRQTRDLRVPHPECKFNPFLTNGFPHHYHLGESTFVRRGIRCDFYFLMKYLLANRIAPDWTLHSAASHLGQDCWPMSHKKEARHI